jgi:hypothetical protein
MRPRCGLKEDDAQASEHRDGWGGAGPAQLLENGRMRDALLNETLFLDLDRATDSRQLGRGLYHGEHSSFWTTRRRHSPPNISPQLAITLRHPMLRSWPVAHIAPESIPTAVVPTAAGWSSVTGNSCPTASAKTSCDDYSTCDQGIHAPPPSRLQRYFHAETVLRPRR